MNENNQEIKVHRRENFTIIDNAIFRDDLSLKAKGLACLMFSLPPTWDFSTNGLTAICQESKPTILKALKELEKGGYLIREQQRTESGSFGKTVFNLYETPQTKKPHTEKPHTEKPHTENFTQLNTNNNKVLNKENTNKINKHTYGEFKKVKLSDDELNKLKNDYPDYWQELIKTLDEYKEMSGKTYKNDYLAIKKWVVDKVEKDKGLDIAKFVGNNTPNPVSSGKRKKVTFDNF